MTLRQGLLFRCILAIGPTRWPRCCQPLSNSIFITTLSTTLTVLVALCAAYFFARVRIPGSAFLWNALLVLMMMPTIANLVPLFRLLTNMNLINTLTALILVGAAGGQAFAIFVLRQFRGRSTPGIV